MKYIRAIDGTQIFYKDWGSGQPIVFSHGWPLTADAWDDQMFFLASNGYRVIAHDRRGHGRSEQSWNGNDSGNNAGTRDLIAFARAVKTMLPSRRMGTAALTASPNFTSSDFESFAMILP
jgi:pimeloyl-ACP methyl ester carboxylesterase